MCWGTGCGSYLSVEIQCELVGGFGFGQEGAAHFRGGEGWGSCFSLMHVELFGLVWSMFRTSVDYLQRRDRLCRGSAK